MAGLLVENGKVDITSNVNQANFTANGQRADYDGTSCSDGMAAIFLQKTVHGALSSELIVNSKEMNIKAIAAVDPGARPSSSKNMMMRTASELTQAILQWVQIK